MASGKSFTLTEKRTEIAIAHFKCQGSINALAIRFGLSGKVLGRHLKAAKVDYKALQLSGMNTLKARMYSLVSEQETAKDEFDAGMKYLGRYEKVEGDTDTASVDVRFTVAAKEVDELLS